MGSGPSSCKWDFVIGFRAHMMELNFICFVIAYFVPQVLKRWNSAKNLFA